MTMPSADSRFDSTGFLLWQVTLAWQRAMRAALDPHELTHVQFVLLTSTWKLGEHEETPTQQRIAEHANVDTMMTSQVLRRLAARQLVSRELDDKDARARRIVLTETGRQVLTGALADVDAADAAFFAALGPDAATFQRCLSLLRDE
ncbi:MAG TPA: MarR family transcriptional regulator [Pseudonocardiaceae bacterium]|jgi:DNA-binding MarR family transcriptional regulator|nr:MarR family transcriptional regulator [Pseudonocardiaceae bacterium]